MKNVSIIVPVYNASETIHTCLDAILNLDYPQELLEIIVVNDGSTDNTVELIQQMKSPRIKIINNDRNRGRAFTRLKGAKESSYDHLLFIDSRVIIDRGALKAIEKSGKSIQSPLTIKGTDTIWESALNSLRRLAFKKFYQSRETTFIDLSNFDDTPKGTTALYIHKELFIRATMAIEYENRYVSEDTKLLLFIVEGGKRIYLNPDFEITYLQRSGLKVNVVHLYERGPRFVDYYYGRHKTYTTLINLTLFSPLFLVGFIYLNIITFPLLLLVLLCLHTCFATLVGEDIRKKCILFFLFPIIASSFGCGVVKGLGIKVWRKIKTLEIK